MSKPKPMKKDDLLTSNQVEGYRQRLKVEERVSTKKDEEEIMKLKELLEEKNNYFSLFKKEELKKKEKEDYLTTN